MELTKEQLNIIKLEIEKNDPLNSQSCDGKGLKVIADALNVEASPEFIVWRTDIRPSEVASAIVGAEYMSLSQPKQNAITLLMSIGIIDASQLKIRQHVGTIFDAGETITALGSLARRKATVLEKLLAIGAGSIDNPATLTVEGQITQNQTDIARRI